MKVLGVVDGALLKLSFGPQPVDSLIFQVSLVCCATPTHQVPTEFWQVTQTDQAKDDGLTCCRPYSSRTPRMVRPLSSSNCHALEASVYFEPSNR